MAMGMLVVPTEKWFQKSLIDGRRPADAHADGHRQEDPGRQVAIEERESLGHAFRHECSPFRPWNRSRLSVAPN